MARSAHRSTLSVAAGRWCSTPQALGGYRDSGTVLVEELVSRGYIVVTIDHTHDSSVVEFPGGRLETTAIPEPTPQVLEQAVAVRVADTRFVLDTLTALNAGINPDAEQRTLPAGLRGALRLSSVGMFGHSLGGAAAAAAMLQDPRIKVGVNLDGTLFGPVVNAGPGPAVHAHRLPGPWPRQRRDMGQVLGQPARLASGSAAHRIRAQLIHRFPGSWCPRPPACSTSRPKPFSS